MADPLGLPASLAGFVCCQGRGQQVLHTLGEQTPVELLRMMAQRLWAKERLMRLEKTHRLLERIGGTWRKQHPRRKGGAVSHGVGCSKMLWVIGGDHRLQSTAQAQRNHRASGSIGLEGDNPKVLQGWK